MKRRLFIVPGVLALIWLASGVYLVRGNEQAVVRRFGRVVPPLRDSGLYLDLPWPFSRVDRVNVHASRTLTIGVPSSEPAESTAFLQTIDIDRQGEFLTGDKNVLHLSISAQYRVTDPVRWLVEARAPETALARLVESLAVRLVSQCGVDYVHPLGLADLRARLTETARQQVELRQWGVTIDDVSIAGAFPPVEVKAAFVDVSNARAERDRLIEAEHALAEKRLAAGRARGENLLDRASAESAGRVQAAAGQADRFRAVIAHLDPAPTSSEPRDVVRRRTMRRLFTAAMEQILPKLRDKVLLDPDRPVDLTVFPPGTEPPDPD